MQEEQHAVEFRNCNVRFDRIEQILPTLATKDDLKGMPTQADPKGFLTKDDIKGMPTQDDPKGFLTKEDLKVIPTIGDPKGFATTAQLKAESAETRRYMKVLHEDLRAEIKLVAEAVVETNRVLARHFHPDLRADIDKIDLRVLKLELKDKKKSRRAS
jgi:hypothetical protein